MKSNTLTDSSKMAVSVTLHCLMGCAIGEIAGMVIGTSFGLSNLSTTILSVTLAFLFGFGLSSIPLISSGITPYRTLRIVLIADTLSIATMEIVDSVVMNVVPDAIGAGLVNPIFWLALPLSLTVAFLAAVPVNKYLIERGKGHSIVHKYHHSGGHQ